MNIVQICTWIAVIITIINALRFPYEFWMNLKWTSVLYIVSLIVTVPVDFSHTWETIAGGFILAAWLFMAWFFVVSFFLSNADRIDDALIDFGNAKQDKKLLAASVKKPRYPVVYGEPVDRVPVYDGYIEEDYPELPSKNPQRIKLLKTPIDLFNRTHEPTMVDNFCTCNHCGANNGWMAGFVNICTTCGRKL